MESKLATVNDVAGKTFDFVIVGGGVAGCVLAARLSENPNVSVALLEAGNAHFEDPLIMDPMGWMKQVFNPEYDWIFRTKAQPNVKNGLTTPDGKPDPSFYWSRGKGLGGSSSINFLFWTRPQKEEIDTMELLGNPGWNWERFYEASKRSESIRHPKTQNHPEYADSFKEGSIGVDGPVAVSFARTCSRSELPFQQALKECGIRTIDDGLSGDLNGSFKATNSVDPRTGTRSTAATGYLYPALDRPNLKVLTGALVSRVLTAKQAGALAATGVEFMHGGQTYSVGVAKDAILSASTVKSPQILELSGIGNPKVLEPLGIPVQLDLPFVGENLQDHLIHCGFVYMLREDGGFVTSDNIVLPDVQKKLRDFYNDAKIQDRLVCSSVSFIPLQDFSPRADALIAAFEQRLAARLAAGPLAPGLEAQLKQQLAMLKDAKVPDIEIVVFPFNMHPDGSGKPFVGLFPSIARPVSRGAIHTVSRDPAAQPEIEPNYFADALDLDILVESMKFVQRVAAQPAWQAAAAAEVIPGPDSGIGEDEDKMRAFIRESVSTTWHSCGTCQMMPKDQGGVVDPHCKVYGTSNLRVVDLSILPVITAVHTQATTYALAEQAADIIKADHGI